MADVIMGLGGYKSQALPVPGAQPWFLPGLSGDSEPEWDVASRLACIHAYQLEQTYLLWFS